MRGMWITKGNRKVWVVLDNKGNIIKTKDNAEPLTNYPYRVEKSSEVRKKHDLRKKLEIEKPLSQTERQKLSERLKH